MNLAEFLANGGVLERRRIAFHTNVTRLVGDAKAGLFLSQAMYWTRTGDCIVERQGWFYKTAAEWSSETGLSRHEIRRARALLSAAGLLEQRVQGFPATCWYRVNLAALGMRLAQLTSCELPPDGLTLAAVRDRAAWVRELTGDVVSFKRTLVHATGDTLSALLLSFLVERRETSVRMREQVNWISVPQATLLENTCLTRRELQTARARLRALGYTEECARFTRQYGRVVPAVGIRLNMPAVEAALAGQAPPAPPPAVNAAHAERLPGQTRSQTPTRTKAQENQSKNLDCDKTRYEFSVIRPDSLPDSATCLYKEVITASTITTTPPNPPRTCPEAGAQGGVGKTSADKPAPVPAQRSPEERPDVFEVLAALGFPVSHDPNDAGDPAWIFPAGLSDILRRRMVPILRQAPQPQRILDELAGRMGNRAAVPVSNPVAYLRVLKNAAVSGHLICDYADAVAAARARAAENARRMAASHSDPPPPPEQARRRPMPPEVRAELLRFGSHRTAAGGAK
ncbi:MAG: hypothetical protein JNJ60_09630 [Rhodocyclaceae bacterium]|nr:hypothetical protein [Rhodocyclaceae bacterium]